MTLHELTGHYLHGFLRTRSTYPDYCRLYRQYFAGWTDHPTRKQVREWHRAVANTPGRANKGLGFLKAMYNWAITNDLWEQENPAAGIRRHAMYDRERTLTHLELQLLMQSLDCVFWKFRALALVLLTTGCRVGEACRMEWTHIDLQAGSWTKPKTKNGRSHRIPVPRQTCLVLQGLTRKNQFVFAGAYDRPFSVGGAEKLWSVLRRATYRAGEKWPALNMPDVRLHDFRRTLASRLLDQGESDRIIKAILNHHVSDVTGIYARASFDSQATALQRQADGLWALTQEVHDETYTPSLPLLFQSADGVRATPTA